MCQAALDMVCKSRGFSKKEAGSHVASTHGQTQAENRKTFATLQIKQHPFVEESPVGVPVFCAHVQGSSDDSFHPKTIRCTAGLPRIPLLREVLATHWA